MNFRFQNLLGAPYRGGNAVVSEDSLLSPVGNRVSVTDLVKSQTVTLPFEATSNISRIAVSPDGNFLLTVDEGSRALFVNLRRRAVLHHITFKKPVKAVRFSPDGALIAVGLGKLLQIWRSPGFRKEVFPFELLRTFADGTAAIISLDWSPDSNYLLVGSKDLIVRLFCVKKTKVKEKPFLFLGHRDAVVGVFFCTEKKKDKVCRIYTISRDGAIFTWNLAENSNVGNTDAYVSDPPSPGTPEQKNSEGDLKKSDNVNEDRKMKIKTYSPDSQMMATGADDNKVKVWTVSSGSCFITFSEHTNAVTAVHFMANNHSLLSASLDGTVRAWDLFRYRNFRTFTTPSPRQFTCLTADQSGEVFVWSMKTGRLLDILSGHEGPVHGLMFSPTNLQEKGFHTNYFMVLPSHIPMELTLFPFASIGQASAFVVAFEKDFGRGKNPMEGGSKSSK
ncbi:hypothetical protein HPP92_024045 [Vanilla planifolia]|uniref:Uncharacterized protein n=1 Tax=Vanilla planifolia TaxID=51239 RepID=A0A835PRG7_VANPL|nr:hypothetical protein HPP92_024045 [Vanilla planifolia]